MLSSRTVRRLLAATIMLVVFSASAPALTAQVTPQVERLAGQDRIETAAALARAANPAPDTIFLVASTDFADGLVAGAAAAAQNGVVALLNPTGVPSATRALLEDHPEARTIIVGGTARLPSALDEDIAALTGTQPLRIAGQSRYETAAAVAARAFPSGVDDVWVVAGTAAPDALSAGAAAAATSGALLSTARDTLPQATADAVANLQPSRITVVGGEAAVSADVEAQLQQLLGTAEVRRIGGANRYATSALVAEAAFDNPSAAVLTTGRFWADALAATPLAGELGGPLLLVPRRCVTDEVTDVLTGIERVVIAGGEAAVSPRIDTLFACADEVVAVAAEELGTSWHSGCPVPPSDLQRVTVDYRGLDDGDVRTGQLVVHRSIARDLLGVFDQLFDVGFAFHKVTTVDEYGADDDVAMAANATTAFNCRTVGGSTSWSRHAYGTAIDINPVQNPYVTSNGIAPDAGVAYVDRGDVRPGMVIDGGPVVQAFSELGWGWGGRWRTVKDYQHFSVSGR